MGSRAVESGSGLDQPGPAQFSPAGPRFVDRWRREPPWRDKRIGTFSLGAESESCRLFRRTLKEFLFFFPFLFFVFFSTFVFRPVRKEELKKKKETCTDYLFIFRYIYIYVIYLFIGEYIFLQLDKCDI